MTAPVLPLIRAPKLLPDPAGKAVAGMSSVLSLMSAPFKLLFLTSADFSEFFFTSPESTTFLPGSAPATPPIATKRAISEITSAAGDVCLLSLLNIHFSVRMGESRPPATQSRDTRGTRTRWEADSRVPKWKVPLFSSGSAIPGDKPTSAIILRRVDP